jgi:hypothetical protein
MQAIEGSRIEKEADQGPIVCMPDGKIISCLEAGSMGLRVGTCDPSLGALRGRYAGGGDHQEKGKIRMVDAPIVAVGRMLSEQLFIALGDCWCTGYPTNKIYSAPSVTEASAMLEAMAGRSLPARLLFVCVDECREDLPGAYEYHGHTTRVIRYVPYLYRDLAGELHTHDADEAHRLRGAQHVNAISSDELPALFHPPRGSSVRSDIGLDMYLDMVLSGHVVDIVLHDGDDPRFELVPLRGEIDAAGSCPGSEQMTDEALDELPVLRYR